jgi:hypothetical protein
MAEPPRRRRTPPSPQRRSSREGTGILPTVALGIGVVVAGLGIGAFLSALQSKNGGTPTAAPTNAFPVVTPVAQPTRGPVAIATIFARATPTPKPTAKPSASATPRRTAPPTTAPTATPAPRASATAQPSLAATPRATGAPAPSPSPRRVAAAPRVVPTPVVITPAPQHVAPVPVETVPSYAQREPERPPTQRPAEGFGVQAQSTVRRYLNALIAGDEGAAYGAFGVAPGDPNVQLSEQAFLDSGARITSLRTTHVDASGATVSVELSTARGPYEATYHVARGANGPVIDQHDYIKI